jgi:2-oxoglutarate dehydrogenase E2 component (dihydrolipoamide succinyltransferase)
VTRGVGDILLTLETDKVSTELQAEKAGTLRIKVPAGSEVKIGEVVATIEEAGRSCFISTRRGDTEVREEREEGPRRRPATGAIQPAKPAPVEPEVRTGSRSTCDAFLRDRARPRPVRLRPRLPRAQRP